MATYLWTAEIKASAEAYAARKTKAQGVRYVARWVDNYDDGAMRGRFVIERA